MVTNWTFSHFTELAVEGCQHLAHMPHCDIAMVPFEFAVVYRPRAGQLALACFVRSCGSEELEAGLPVGDKVSVS